MSKYNILCTHSNVQTTCEEKDVEIANLREEKDMEIAKLHDEITSLRETIKCLEDERREEDQSPLMTRHNSHSHARPHSIHIDLSDREDVSSRHDSGESPNLGMVVQAGGELLVPSHVKGTNNNLNLNSALKLTDQKEEASHEDGTLSSQETENLNVVDTGT